MAEFQAFPKVPRLNRDITITEKIDGTNACIVIEKGIVFHNFFNAAVAAASEEVWTVTAQSRKRIITPEQDNFGFAQWVVDNTETLVEDLGEGYHYGEWWGRGIQRGYGQTERYFSLFNTARWAEKAEEFQTPNLNVVPVLYEGLYSDWRIQGELFKLEMSGSRAASGWPNAEGIIIYHHAARQMFKVTLQNDAEPKSLKAVAA